MGLQPLSKVIYLTDRSRIVTREECERKRYLNYDFDVFGEPMGIQRKAASLPLLNGTEIHEAHAKVLASYSIDSTVKEMKERYEKVIDERGVYTDDNVEHLMREQLTLLEGMLRAFTRLWMPRILAEYDIVNIEQSHDWELAPGLVQKLRFDTMVRRRADRTLAILDWKSMRYISEAWSVKLERSRQTSLYTQAAEEIYGEPVEIGYVGMVKGAWRKDTAKSSPFYGQKIQASPYLYAYTLESEDKWQTAYTPRKGYRKVRIADEMPVEKWVDWLFEHEPETVNELFTFTPPFAPTPRERRRVKELVIREELAYIEDIRQYKALLRKANETGDPNLLQQAQDFLDFVAAPMRDENCGKYGQDNLCSYYGVCHTEGGLENINLGDDFEVREPHHETTVETEEAA
jgi:hypothetical protein